jgi:hypothetical protein
MTRSSPYRLLLALLAAACLPGTFQNLNAQFEQKVSLNFETGLFKTVGPKTYAPDWATSREDNQPTQMSNYKPGLVFAGGLQFNLNRHLSLQADIGFMHAWKWEYRVYDKVNYLDYRITDAVTSSVLAEGSNRLNLSAMCLALAPKYYLLPGKKLNPYLFTGVMLSYVTSTYEDNEWKAYRDLKLLAADDTGPSNPYLEKSVGIGFNPGIGIEYPMGDKAGFFLTTGYHFTLLNKNAFKTSEQREDFMALSIKTGLRFSFIKSKVL